MSITSFPTAARIQTSFQQVVNSKLWTASGEALLLPFLYFFSPGCVLDHVFWKDLPRDYVGKPNDMFWFNNSFSYSLFRYIFICFHKSLIQSEPEVPSVPVFWEVGIRNSLYIIKTTLNLVPLLSILLLHQTQYYGAIAIKSSLYQKRVVSVSSVSFMQGTARPTLRSHHKQTKLGHIFLSCF